MRAPPPLALPGPGLAEGARRTSACRATPTRDVTP